MTILYMLVRSPTALSLVPPFMLIELSTVPLNMSWLLTKAGMGESALTQLSLVTFAGAFFALRVLWLPYALYSTAGKHPKVWKDLGVAGRCSLYVAQGLQWYWGSLVAKKVIGM